MLAGQDLTRRVLELCDEQGFVRAGVCPVEPSQHAEHIRTWLASGRHGEMGYLADQIETRLDPTREVPGARSFLIVADRYASRDDPPDSHDPSLGKVARYARGKDYHEIIKRRLHALADTLRAELNIGRTDEHIVLRSFVDTAPVLEREHAERAGLGWIGKHTLLIDPEFGSYLLLGGILTNLELPPLPAQRSVPDHCGTCTRCLDACPTDAITPYSVDATRCISYLTLEHRSEIDPSLQHQVGSWVAGCDVCQEVCPHNSPRPSPTPGVTSLYQPTRDGFPLIDVLSWDESDRREAVRGSALKRLSLSMFKRNAIVAIANAASSVHLDPEPVIQRLEEIVANDAEDDLVKSTARERLAWLSRSRAGQDLG